MVIAILIAIVGLVFAIWYGISEKEVLTPIGITFVGVMFAVIFSLLSSIWSGYIPIEKCEVKTYSTKIVALADNTAPAGSFVLGTGIVKSTTYYYYMTETPSGYKLEKIATDRVYVRESDTTKPRYEFVQCVGFKNWYDYIFNVPGEVLARTLYVPTNTIYRNFAIDLQ